MLLTYLRACPPVATEYSDGTVNGKCKYSVKVNYLSSLLSSLKHVKGKYLKFDLVIGISKMQ